MLKLNLINSSTHLPLSTDLVGIGQVLLHVAQSQMSALNVHLLSDILGGTLLVGAILLVSNLVLGQVGRTVVGARLFLYPGSDQVLGNTDVSYEPELVIS